MSVSDDFFVRVEPKAMFRKMAVISQGNIAQLIEVYFHMTMH